MIEIIELLFYIIFGVLLFGMLLRFISILTLICSTITVLPYYIIKKQNIKKGYNKYSNWLENISYE